MADSTDSRDAVLLQHTFDAPVALVWRMWTEAEHFAAWYGPTGASIPVARMDVRVGGGRLVCMEMPTPNGPMQMWFTGDYREIIEGRRLVYTESMSNENGDVMTPAEMGMPEDHPVITVVTVEFEALGEQTAVTLTHEGIPADSPGAAGWTMAFDTLEAHLAAQG
jgi:uncharacterized protein YndB with AHSA1/START domain